MRRSPLSLLVIVIVPALAGGCAPVFSDFQSARLVEPGRVEVTPSASGVSVSGEDGGHVQNEFGAQVATGVHDRVELRGRYVHVEGINVVGVGPKVSLVKDKVALAAPIGFAFGEDVDSSKSWQVHPTLFLTAPISPRFEMGLSTKALIPFSEGDTTIAVNLGMGIGNLQKWAIRPEVGFLFDPGESGHYTQYGIAFTYTSGQPRAAN